MDDPLNRFLQLRSCRWRKGKKVWKNEQIKGFKCKKKFQSDAYEVCTLDCYFQVLVLLSIKNFFLPVDETHTRLVTFSRCPETV